MIADVEPKATIAQEEIFGPVLAVIKCQNFEQGLEIANNTEFGLTGSYYGAAEEKIERAMHDFHVGNLYINRKSTGAMVGAHPFGGFNMSGTDSKAGGPDYSVPVYAGEIGGQEVKLTAGGGVQPRLEEKHFGLPSSSIPLLRLAPELTSTGKTLKIIRLVLITELPAGGSVSAEWKTVSTC